MAVLPPIGGCRLAVIVLDCDDAWLAAGAAHANGAQFFRRAILTWAHARGATLLLIEPGKPTQNAYIEPFNGRFRDKRLNELVHEPGAGRGHH